MQWGDPKEQLSREAYRAIVTVADAPRLYEAAAPSAMQQRRAGVTFEYQGATAMTVVSPLTRRTYCFSHPGARLEVDPRDTAWLTFTRNLVRTGA